MIAELMSLYQCCPKAIYQVSIFKLNHYVLCPTVLCYDDFHCQNAFYLLLVFYNSIVCRIQSAKVLLA